MTNILVNEINIKIENATIDDLNSITELEAICFLPSEAASKQSFKRRIERFPESFFVAKHNDKIIGVVNGCMTNSEVIFDEMYHDDKHHIPSGDIQTVFGCWCILIIEEKA